MYEVVKISTELGVGNEECYCSRDNRQDRARKSRCENEMFFGLTRSPVDEAIRVRYQKVAAKKWQYQLIKWHGIRALVDVSLRRDLFLLRGAFSVAAVCSL
ncbi:hypothetical protein G4G30_16875 [Stenotrophomonas maltophilia]|nr:hypothetical protein G4G30_16875 [Stenotrophomonas maltophilia]